jgi:hypothetical protein
MKSASKGDAPLGSLVVAMDSIAVPFPYYVTYNVNCLPFSYYSQSMQRRYAVKSEIRYYKPSCNVDIIPGPHPRLRVTPVGSTGEAFDFSRWKDAPHVALANLRDEPESVARFIRTYGLLARDKRRTVPVREVLEHRDSLRRAWEGDTFNFFAFPAWRGATLCAGQAGGFLIAIDALWPLIQVMFIQDWTEKPMMKCANPDCIAPYFCAVRRGQSFCSHKCAGLISVRRFRKREATQS